MLPKISSTTYSGKALCYPMKYHRMSEWIKVIQAPVVLQVEALGCRRGQFSKQVSKFDNLNCVLHNFCLNKNQLKK